MLLRNAFPAWLLDRIIKRSVANFVQPKVIFGPANERLYIGLPFLGTVTDRVRRSISIINKQLLPHLDIIVYFKPGRRVCNFFQTKDSTPFDLCARLVYEYKCAVCNNSYIGQTARHLRHRIAEHAGVSHLTGKIMKSQFHSNIRDHCTHCTGSDCTAPHFKILAQGSTETELLVKERLLINRLCPEINGNSGSFELLLA